MSAQLDETHDPTVTSWLTCANDANSDFLIQNLPLGVFRTRGTKAAARVGAAIGVGRVFEGAAAAAAAACNAPSVNALMELGPRPLLCVTTRTLAVAAQRFTYAT